MVTHSKPVVTITVHLHVPTPSQCLSKFNIASTDDSQNQFRTQSSNFYTWTNLPNTNVHIIIYRKSFKMFWCVLSGNTTLGKWLRFYECSLTTSSSIVSFDSFWAGPRVYISVGTVFIRPRHKCTAMRVDWWEILKRSSLQHIHNKKKKKNKGKKRKKQKKRRNDVCNSQILLRNIDAFDFSLVRVIEEMWRG